MKVEIELDTVEGDITTAVIEECARKLLKAYVYGYGEDSEDGHEVSTPLERRLTDMILEEVREQARAAAPDVAATMLEQGIQRYGGFGELRGEPVTLREVVAEEIAKQVQGHSRNGPGVLEKLIQEQVKVLLRKELLETVEAAKVPLLEAVRTEAESVLAAAMKKALG
jgi:hypothetical protein